MNQAYSFIGFGTLKLDGKPKHIYFDSDFTDATDDRDACSGTSVIVGASGTRFTAARG